MKTPIKFRRSQTQLCVHTGRESGLLVYWGEAVRLFGEQFCQFTLEYDVSVVICHPDEPARSLNRRMEEWGLSAEDVASWIDFDLALVQRILDPGQESLIEDIAEVAKLLGLNPVTVGHSEVVIDEHNKVRVSGLSAREKFHLINIQALRQSHIDAQNNYQRAFPVECLLVKQDSVVDNSIHLQPVDYKPVFRRFTHSPYDVLVQRDIHTSLIRHLTLAYLRPHHHLRNRIEDSQIFWKSENKVIRYGHLDSFDHDRNFLKMPEDYSSETAFIVAHNSQTYSLRISTLGESERFFVVVYIFHGDISAESLSGNILKGNWKFNEKRTDNEKENRILRDFPIIQ